MRLISIVFLFFLSISLTSSAPIPSLCCHSARNDIDFDRQGNSQGHDSIAPILYPRVSGGAGKAVAKVATKAAPKVASAAKSVGSKVGSSAKSIGSSVGSSAKKVGGTVGSEVNSAAHSVGGAFKSVGSKLFGGHDAKSPTPKTPSTLKVSSPQKPLSAPNKLAQVPRPGSSGPPSQKASSPASVSGQRPMHSSSTNSARPIGQAPARRPIAGQSNLGNAPARPNAPARRPLSNDASGRRPVSQPVNRPSTGATRKPPAAGNRRPASTGRLPSTPAGRRPAVAGSRRPAAAGGRRPPAPTNGRPQGKVKGALKSAAGKSVKAAGKGAKALGKEAVAGGVNPTINIGGQHNTYNGAQPAPQQGQGKPPAKQQEERNPLNTMKKAAQGAAEGVLKSAESHEGRKMMVNAGKEVLSIGESALKGGLKGGVKGGLPGVMAGVGVGLGKEVLKDTLPKSAIKTITGNAVGNAAVKVADFLFRREELAAAELDSQHAALLEELIW